MTSRPSAELITNTAVTADLVVLTIQEQRLRVLLVERSLEPFRGQWALPGGFVLPDEDLAAAAERELVEETGLTHPARHLEQLGTYGAPGRDPRGRVVTVAYLALLADLPTPRAGTDAADAGWFDLTATPELAFDHGDILDDGLERARAKLEYTTLATSFLAEEFALSDLRAVYETVWGGDLDPANFRRKVLATDGFVEPTGLVADPPQRGRPAQLYRRGPASTLAPPILRPEGTRS